MIADPMADLGGTSQAPGADESNAKEVFDPVALNMNLQRVDKVRSFMGILAGCVAGICGLTGWDGLVCFVALHVTVMLSLAAFKMGFQLKLHIRQSWTGYLTAGIQQSALSFMLFWTLFYGLVHLY
mmetsp:Transcript_2928/g.6513  ORF Transcript_2928/g.6513 Transcript_2928/m.6513 type:complete len:126 (+) Transcript_2928:196-573(+)|eukprot:CAMPEP_0116835640 /NCGR_PEP_ID=MMETSP0418-20121206/7656_1 /TAXON_ID=1158023 /ORGANISM="Astrosyne radiata, Strain 13vi08-1A" /LENGTH=125 /DNA_ID=CAMNT_0004465327 /DNA_START=175 /DNA_END=552 /DNA_ORIENTATION=+